MTRFLVIALAALVAVTDERTPVPGFFDLPVTGGTATYEELGLAPEERGTALALLARQIHSQGAAASDRAIIVRRLAATLGAPASPLAPGAAPITIAAPLTADHWRDLLELGGRADLFPALLSNRSVLLVCGATMTADPSMRQLLDRDRAHRAGRLLGRGARAEDRQRQDCRARRRRRGADLGGPRG